MACSIDDCNSAILLSMRGGVLEEVERMRMIRYTRDLTTPRFGYWNNRDSINFTQTDIYHLSVYQNFTQLYPSNDLAIPDNDSISATRSRQVLGKFSLSLPWQSRLLVHRSAAAGRRLTLPPPSRLLLSAVVATWLGLLAIVSLADPVCCAGVSCSVVIWWAVLLTLGAHAQRGIL